MYKGTINDIIVNILLILFSNVFQTLKWKYMLNLISSDKTSKTQSPLYVQSLQTWLSMHLLVDISILVYYCMSISLSARPVDQQRKLAVRFYSKWYCATSGVDLLARRFRLALNRYIVCESANVKVCKYQVMKSNGLFEGTNEQHIFSEVFYN